MVNILFQVILSILLWLSGKETTSNAGDLTCICWRGPWSQKITEEYTKAPCSKLPQIAFREFWPILNVIRHEFCDYSQIFLSLLKRDHLRNFKIHEWNKKLLTPPGVRCARHANDCKCCSEWVVTLPVVRAQLNPRVLLWSWVLFFPLSLSTNPLVNAIHIIKSMFFWAATFQLLSLPDSLKKKKKSDFSSFIRLSMLL